MKSIELKDRAEWRAWLTQNHDRENEIWLIYTKKATGIPCIEYLESLDEALCFGWVDSLIADRRISPIVGRRETIGTAIMHLMHQLTHPCSPSSLRKPRGHGRIGEFPKHFSKPGTAVSNLPRRNH